MHKLLDWLKSLLISKDTLRTLGRTVLILIAIVGVCKLAQFLALVAIFHARPCLEDAQPGDDAYPMIPVGSGSANPETMPFSRLTLPLSTTNFEARCFFFMQGGEAFVNFEMDNDELDEFLETHYVEDLSEADSRPGFGPRKRLVKASAYEHAHTSWFEGGAGGDADIWIFRLDDGRVRVYIMLSYGG